MQLTRRLQVFGIPCLMLAAVSFPAYASGKAHTHGQMELDVAVDGQQLSIQIEAPLDSLLGFEHAPRNAKERKAADELLQRMRNGAGLLQPSPAAQCTLVRQDVESAVLTAAAPAKAGAGAHAHEEEEHADLDADYEFRCLQPAQLGQVEHGLFEAFSRLNRIEVRIAGAKGQSKQTLKRPAKMLKLLP